MEAYCAANVVEKAVVVAAAEVDVELVLCHANGLQADVEDVLCARTEPSASVPANRIGGTTCRLSTPGCHHRYSISSVEAASVVATMFVTADCRGVIPVR